MENDTHGFLRVAVSTAGGSIPIAGARVIVRGDDGKEIVLVTDESGLTALTPLFAPSAANSQSAFNENPFALYSIAVEKDGFYRQLTDNVPIFAGITARQPVNLIGLAEYLGESFSPSGNTETVQNDPQALHTEGGMR